MESFWKKSSKIASFTADRSSGDRLVSTEPAFPEGSRRFPKKGIFPKLASDSSSCCSDTTDEYPFAYDLWLRPSKQGAGAPMKKLLAEEMSRETESKRRSPSVIARLMGLDGLPPQHPSRKQKKRSTENYQQRSTSVEKAERPGTFYGRRSSRNSSKEEQEFKDVFEVLETSKVESSSYSSKGTANSKLTEAEMAFIQQKFMDAKRLSTDEKLQDSKEFHEALEVLDSNKDLLLKFLQQPDSLFTKHLHDLQGAPPQSHCGHISAMKSSHAPKYGNNGLGWKAERETPRKNHSKSPRKHPDGLSSHSCSRIGPHNSRKSPKIQLEEKDDSAVLCTRIVVLKPNLAKAENATKTVTSPHSSHAFLSNFRKHTELPNIKNRGAELWEKKSVPDEVGLSRHKSRESREIAKEITRKMRNSFSSGSMNISTSGFRGYVGDESSCDVFESESTNESEVTTMTSRDTFDWNDRYRPSSSHSTESSVSREAKKRLSERWKMTHNSQEAGMVSRSSTLGEMLAIPDKEVKPENLDAMGFREKIVSSEGQVGWVEPLGISSREGWKDGCIKNLSRSRSLPSSSSAFGSPKTGMHREKLHDDRYMMPKEAIKRETNKAVKGNLARREGSFSRNSRSRAKKSQSSHRTNRESTDASPDFYFSQNQVKSNCKEDSPSEQNLVLGTSAGIVSDLCSAPENVIDVGHENVTMSSKTSDQESSAPLFVNGDSSSVDLDILSSQEPSDGPSKEVTLHGPVPELESPASSKEGDQPSPVSVLEPPFTDDLSAGSECFGSLSADLHGLRMQLQLLKLESEAYEEGPMLVSSDDDAGEGSVGFADGKEILRAEENWELSYVADVLSESGFNNADPDTFMATCNSPECPVNSLVFEELEKKYCNLNSWSRSERKLMFDSINSKLLEIYEQFADPHPWVRLETRIDPKWSKIGLEDGLLNLLASQDKKANKDTLGKVLARESQWLDLGDDVDVIGREIEILLIEELVSEVVAM